VLEAFTVLRGRAYVRLARAGLMPIGGGFSSLVDHAARLERLRKALARDQAEARAISSERQRLAKKLDELEARRELLEGERDALERSHAVIAAAKERELAFRRAFESSYEPDHTAVYSGSAGGVEEADMTAGFSAMRGRLSFPISGRAEIREARRGNGGPGLEMVAPLGSAVRAMFPGRVAFVDAYPSFGTTVIIDHGEGYFSVNAGFSEVSVTVGREVTAGQTLGRLGPSGVLYVEIRKERQTLEPAPWFGI
jgi:septal ring factor EnvC (AmiA/AmiB activator)